LVEPLWKRLLPDWDLVVEWAAREEIGALGVTNAVAAVRKAVIKIAPHEAGEDLAETVGHEVGHVLWWPVTEMLDHADPRTLALIEPIAERQGCALAVVPAAVAAGLARAVPKGLRRSPKTSRPLRRAGGSMLDAAKVAALAMQAGEMAAREDVPEDVRGFLKALITALAGGAEPDGDEAPAAREGEADSMADPAAYRDGEPEKSEEMKRLRALAALGEMALARTGERDPLRAKGKLGAALDLADNARTSLARVKAEGDALKRTKLWEDAVRDGRAQLQQVFRREEYVDPADKKTKTRRVYADWAKAQNAAYPEIESFEAWVSSRVPEPGARREDPHTALADHGETKRAGAYQLSDRDREEARRAGVDPDLLANVLRRQRSGAIDPAQAENRV
jgi:hypothetical protein